MASIVPPCSLILLAICIEKSTPTPTKIDPIITVIRERSTSSPSIASHCIITVNPTGSVVRIAYLTSLNTKARVSTVNNSANPRDDHCESTIKLLTSIVMEATPINVLDVTAPSFSSSA